MTDFLCFLFRRASALCFIVFLVTIEHPNMTVPTGFLVASIVLFFAAFLCSPECSVEQTTE